MEHTLAPGEINVYYGFSAFFVGYYLFMNDILFRVARGSLIEFHPLLGMPGSERDRIMFEFTHLPEKGARIAFVAGAAIGLPLALIQVQTAYDMNNAFPEFEVTVFFVTFGLMILSVYHVARAFTLITRVFDSVKSVDIYDQRSSYALSRYSMLIVVLTALAIYLGFILSPYFSALGGYYGLAFLVGMSTIALACFFLPLRAVHAKLVAEKRVLLKDVSLRVKETFEFIHGKIDKHKLKELVEFREALEGLKAEKDYIESIPIWPWRPATLTAVVTPLVIGLLVQILSQLFKF